MRKLVLIILLLVVSSGLLGCHGFWNHGGGGHDGGHHGGGHHGWSSYGEAMKLAMKGEN